MNSSQHGRASLLGVVIALAVGVIAGAWAVIHWNLTPRMLTSGGTASQNQPRHAVACLGYIAPDQKVIRVAGPSLAGRPSVIHEVSVQENDAVKASQCLAIMNAKPELEAAWREAEAQVKRARARLQEIKAGAKLGDIEAQKAEVARLATELKNAQDDLRRQEALARSGTVSASELDRQRTKTEAARHQHETAKQKLVSLSEVRPTDVESAEAEVEAAQSQARKTQAQHELTTIRSPVDGCVVKIHAWPGEEIGLNGFCELAKTDPMYAVAEVYETDIGRVRVGQPVVVTGDSFPGRQLEGVVERIGVRVGKSSVFPTNPAAYTDARVVEVRVRLKDNAIAARLIHAQVTCVFKP